MEYRFKTIIALSALILVNTTAVGLPFNFIETRSMGMGGSGVASARAEAAPLFNPALLSIVEESDKYTMIMPTIGAHQADPSQLMKSYHQFQDGKYIDKLQSDVVALKAATSTLTLDYLAINIAANAIGNPVNGSLTLLSGQLSNLNNKPIAVDGGIATVISLPRKNLGRAFYTQVNIVAGGIFNYTDADTLKNYAATAESCASATNIIIVPNIASCLELATFDTNSLTSGINIRGVVLGEIGFAISQVYEIAHHDIAIGITPKIISAQLFDVLFDVKNTNTTNVNKSDYEARYTIANFDAGFAYDYRNGWRTGLVVKNVLPYKFSFKSIPSGAPTGSSPVENGHTLFFSPQARVGVSRVTSWSAISLDVDLTRNDPAGLEDSTQYIALGAELYTFTWAQLRAGYRIDRVNRLRNVASFGLGLANAGILADLAVSGNENEIGASFQFGFKF